MVEHDILLMWGWRFNPHQLPILCHCVVTTARSLRRLNEILVDKQKRAYDYKDVEWFI